MNWRSISELILPKGPEESGLENCSEFERFAIPYKFQPALRVSDAAVFALRSLLRIILGSLLFGVWGAYTLLAWTSIHNPYLRAAAMVPMAALFLILLAGLMALTTLLLHRGARR